MLLHLKGQVSSSKSPSSLVSFSIMGRVASSSPSDGPVISAAAEVWHEPDTRAAGAHARMGSDSQTEAPLGMQLWKAGLGTLLLSLLLTWPGAGEWQGGHMFCALSWTVAWKELYSTGHGQGFSAHVLSLTLRNSSLSVFSVFLCLPPFLLFFNFNFQLAHHSHMSL